MAGTIMHLVIADRLLIPLSIHNPSYFYCGNLAPDAVMNRENYEREMKRHTHLKDHMRLYRFHEPENYKVYSQRLQSFYEDYVAVEDKHHDIYFGYFVHLLTDELYILNFRDRHVNKLLSIGKEPTDSDYFSRFGQDVNQVDWKLLQTYTFRYPMPDSLHIPEKYEIPGYVTNRELLDSKNYIIQKNFDTPHLPEPLQTMSYEENLEFIELCVNRIPLILKERFSLCSD